MGTRGKIALPKMTRRRTRERSQGHDVRLYVLVNVGDTHPKISASATSIKYRQVLLPRDNVYKCSYHGCTARNCMLNLHVAQVVELHKHDPTFHAVRKAVFNPIFHTVIPVTWMQDDHQPLQAAEVPTLHGIIDVVPVHSLRL